MQSDFKEKLSLVIVGSVALIVSAFAFGAVGQFFGANTSSTAQQIQEIKEEIEEIRVEVQTSEYSAKNLLEKAVVISNFENTVRNGEPTASVDKKLTVVGKIKKGYLHAKISVDGHPLSKFDSLYLKVGATLSGKYREIGGHLRRDKSLDIPASPSSTEVLFDLASVFFVPRAPYREDLEAYSADFLQIFNGGEKHRVIAFSSTLMKGQIEEVAVYYDCEEDSECRIASE